MKKYHKSTYNNHVSDIRYLYKRVINNPEMLEVLKIKDLKDDKNE